MKLATFSAPWETNNETKATVIIEKNIENRYEVTLDSFPSFAYVSSYLNLKDFAWKRD